MHGWLDPDVLAAVSISHRVEGAEPGADGTRDLLAAALPWADGVQLEATWLIHSRETSDHIRDQLSELVRDGDALIVVGAGQDAAWAGLRPPNLSGSSSISENDGRFAVLLCKLQHTGSSCDCSGVFEPPDHKISNLSRLVRSLSSLPRRPRAPGSDHAE